MKNKLNLLTLIVTIVFSFAVTSVVWAECDVAISPSFAFILPEHWVTFTAETTCDGVVQTATSYTWEISEGTCTGGNIDPDTGTYTSGAEDNICQDTIMVTDTVNGGIVAIATVVVAYCLPSVTISGPDVLGLPCPVSATYTAETVVCDIVSGTYTWELDGVSAGTGNTFEVDCTETGIKVLTVTDTANGNISDSIVIACYCEPPIEPPMEATIEGCGRTLLYSFGVVTIQGVATVFGPGVATVFGPLTTVNYDSPLVIKLPKLVNRSTQTITQFVILMPSIFFPVWDYPATVEVTASGSSLPYSLTDGFFIPKCGQ